MKFLLILTLFLISVKAEILDVNILYLEQKIEKPPVLSNIIEDPENLGLVGAQLAVKDSNKSAKFLNQNFNLKTAVSYDKKELLTSLEKFINENNSYEVKSSFLS